MCSRLWLNQRRMHWHLSFIGCQQLGSWSGQVYLGVTEGKDQKAKLSYLFGEEWNVVTKGSSADLFCEFRVNRFAVNVTIEDVESTKMTSFLVSASPLSASALLSSLWAFTVEKWYECMSGILVYTRRRNQEGKITSSSKYWITVSVYLIIL